jgi:arylsulfatase
MPRLDAFATRAVIFTDCRSTSGHTLASHKSMLSGRLPSVWLESFSASHEGATLRNPNAYYRAAMREWPHPPVARLLSDAGHSTAGFTDGGYVSDRFGFAEGFDVYGGRGRGLANHARDARQWLESLEPGRPFFLFLHTYDVHCPYNPPPAYLRLFGHECTGRLRFEGTCGKDYFNNLDLTAEEQEHVEVHYDAGVRYADDQLGDFLDWLDSTGRLGDTAVIVTSDHGESLGERSFVGHGELYDNQLHVPLVISVPGVAPAVVDTPVSGVDVAATILDLLTGAEAGGLDGRSLRDLLAGDARGSDDHPIVASVALNEGRAQVTRLRKTAAREGDGLKLIADPDGGTLELFDLERDPDEARNLVGTGDPRESPALEVGRVAATKPLRGLADGEENLEDEGIPPETVEALRALGYVED